MNAFDMIPVFNATLAFDTPLAFDVTLCTFISFWKMELLLLRGKTILKTDNDIAFLPTV